MDFDRLRDAELHAHLKSDERKKLEQEIEMLEEALKEAEGRAYLHLETELEELRFILEAYL